MSRSAASLPRLHVVTDDAVLARADLIRVASSICAAGGPRLCLHVRGPHTPGRRVYEITEALRDIATASGARLAVNDRLDVALALRVQAVQLGARSLPAAVARGLLGEGVAIGRSVHGVKGARAAIDAGADHLVYGHVFDTPSHPQRPGRGLAELARVVQTTDALPVIAIGGVTPRVVPDVMATGAHGIAVVRGVWGAPDPAGAVSEYLTGLDRWKETG